MSSLHSFDDASTTIQILKFFSILNENTIILVAVEEAQHNPIHRHQMLIESCVHGSSQFTPKVHLFIRRPIKVLFFVLLLPDDSLF